MVVGVFEIDVVVVLVVIDFVCVVVCWVCLMG